MSSTVVHVQNISSQTSEKEVRDFFSFCGKISSLSVTPSSDAADSPKTATVTFEKETAAKTALLLDNTQLGPSQVHVSAAANLEQLASSAGGAAQGEGLSEEELRQDEKPRSRIVAEYLAHGYALSDGVIQKAIAMDNKHGISNRFTNALSSFDSKYKASEKARGLDSQYKLSDKAQTGWNNLSSYFVKAMGTPTGQKLAAFYEKGDKEVRDIHTEARRLADLKGGKTGAGEASDLTPAEAAAAGVASSGGNAPTAVPGTDKTTCQCAGKDGACPCQEGKCACSGCGKSAAALSSPPTATGPADTVASSTGIPPIAEKQ